jgi:phosphoribosylaminoimidazole carboxylase PurE protein
LAKRNDSAGAAASLVAVLMGSDSDLPVMRGTVERLRELGVPCEAHVLSAHRCPQELGEFVRGCSGRGIRVIIAAAGAAAHLAGSVAAQTTLPVIGVPLVANELGGLDALLATVQMPAGVPVATVATGKAGAVNAAVLAAEILALSDPKLAARLSEIKREMAAGVADKDRKVQEELTR